MAARAGMANLITRWRRMVDDGGTATWSDDEAEDLLDLHRTDIWALQLTPVPLITTGTTQWQTYTCDYENLEGTASTAAWRIYNSGGTAATGYTLDEQRGIVTFTADQGGTTYYIDARSYDLNAAAADAWREYMAAKADHYDFSADGGRYNRAQWFDHCKAMAAYYDSKSSPMVVSMVRSDVNP